MANRKLKTYKVTQDSDVFAISLVDNPAIESTFVYMNEQKQMNFKADEEKHLVYGAVMIPNFPIYRRLENEEFNVIFPEDTVQKMSQKFLKNGYQHSWTRDHNEEANGITVVESWIKTDMGHDKSVAIGLDKDLPIGTWFVGAKIDDVDLWDKVKSGEWSGFSIEAFIELDEIESKFSIETQIDEDSFLDKLKGIINEALGRNVQPQAIIDNSNVAEEETEVLEPVIEQEMSEEEQTATQEQPTEQVEQKNDESTEVVIPVVEGSVNGTPVNIEDGVVQPVEQPQEEPQEQPSNEENELKDTLASLTNELASIKQQLEELKVENARLASHPSVNPINVNRNTQPMGSVIETIDKLRNGTYFK